MNEEGFSPNRASVSYLNAVSPEPNESPSIMPSLQYLKPDGSQLPGLTNLVQSIVCKDGIKCATEDVDPLRDSCDGCDLVLPDLEADMRKSRARRVTVKRVAGWMLAGVWLVVTDNDSGIGPQATQ